MRTSNKGRFKSVAAYYCRSFESYSPSFWYPASFKGSKSHGEAAAALFEGKMDHVEDDGTCEGVSTAIEREDLAPAILSCVTARHPPRPRTVYGSCIDKAIRCTSNHDGGTINEQPRL